VEEQDKIHLFLDKIFENQDRINYNEYDAINREVSSEMFYSIMFTLHEKLPFTQNFFKMKRDFRLKNNEPHSPISPMAIKTIASPKFVAEFSASRQRSFTCHYTPDCSPTLRGMSPGLISRSPDVRIKKGVNAQQIRNRSRTKHYENAGGEISDTGASNMQQN
jgi:hypothetical protein